MLHPSMPAQDINALFHASRLPDIAEYAAHSYQPVWNDAWPVDATQISPVSNMQVSGSSSHLACFAYSDLLASQWIDYNQFVKAISSSDCAVTTDHLQTETSAPHHDPAYHYLLNGSPVTSATSSHFARPYAATGPSSRSFSHLDDPRYFGYNELVDPLTFQSPLVQSAVTNNNLDSYAHFGQHADVSSNCDGMGRAAWSPWSDAETVQTPRWSEYYDCIPGCAYAVGPAFNILPTQASRGQENQSKQTRKSYCRHTTQPFKVTKARGADPYDRFPRIKKARQARFNRGLVKSSR